MKRLVLALLLALSVLPPGAAVADPSSSRAPTANVDDLFGGLGRGPGGVAAEAVQTSDSDQFRSTRVRAGTLVHYESAYDFAAIGFGGTRYRQHDWSADRYTLFGAVRKTGRATGAGLMAVGGVSSIGDRQHLVFDATWNARLSERTGAELIGQRDFVETRPGLEDGTMANFLAASLDHSLTDRLTVVGLAGAQYFSDDNTRTHLRGTVIYVLVPDWGLGVQARARGYESSRSGGGFYFNPDRYERADVGLRLRRSLGADWRVLGAAGLGRERISGDVENPTGYVDFRAERSFSNNMSLVLNLSYQHNSDSDSATGNAYIWRYFRAILVAPF